MMKGIIFDLGHTLIDYHNDWVKPEEVAVDTVYEMASSKRDGVPEREEFGEGLRNRLSKARTRKRREMIEIPLQRILRSFFDGLGIREENGLVERSMEIFYGTLLEHRELVTGTVDMLSEVKSRGYRVGLISDVAWGLPSRFPRRDMREYGLEEYFDDLIFSTDVELRKPNPKIFELSLFRLGIEPDNAVYIGNSLQADIKGALHSDMWAVLKRSSYFFPDDTIRPHLEIGEWKEIERVLDHIFS